MKYNNINQTELLNKLKKDLEETEATHQTVIEYVTKTRQLYEGNVNIKQDDDLSKFISKEVFKQVEWAKTQYKYPFVSNDEPISIQASHDEYDTYFGHQSAILLNYFFTKKFNRFNFITDLIHTACVEGNVIIRTGWEYQGKIIKVKKQIETPLQLPTDTQLPNVEQITQIQEIEVEEEIPIVNKPTAEIVKIDDIYIDPTAKNIDDIQYIIQRREVRLYELKREGIYINLDKVKKDISNMSTNKNVYVQPYKEELNPTLAFNAEDVERKKVYMYEYWGYQEINGEIQPIVCCWIGDTIVRLEENPYPDKKIPYVIMPYIKIPNTLWGKSLAELIEEHQTIKTGILRGMFDNIAQSNAPQVGVQKGNLDSINFKRFIEGKHFEFNMSPNTFYKGQYNRIPSEIFQVLRDVDYDKQVLSGIVPMQGGQGSQAIYGSQAAKSGSMNSLMLKEVDTVNNIAENLIKPLMFKWLIYIYDVMDPEEIQSITKLQYIEPREEYLVNYADNITIDIETEQTKTIKASELAFLLQTLGQTLPFDFTKTILAEMTDLKGIKNLSEKIKQYEPQPDPVQQQMTQLQLQKMQLELQILQGQAQADIQLKEAKAKEAEAKATNTNTGTIKQKYGIDYQQKLQELQLKHQLEMQKLQEKYNLDRQVKLPNNVGINKNTPENIPNDISNNQLM